MLATFKVYVRFSRVINFHQWFAQFITILYCSDTWLNIQNFVYGKNTQSYVSCSASLHGHMYVFGGHTQTTQISVVANCGLLRVGNLPSPLTYGSCNTYEMGEDYFETLLCFDVNHGSTCHRLV